MPQVARAAESWHDTHAVTLVELERDSQLLVLAVKHMKQDRDIRDIQQLLERALELSGRISGGLEEL